MGLHLSDQEIQALLAEEKNLSADYRQKIQAKAKRGHKESEFDVKGVNGSEFRMILRQSNFNPVDFSIILVFRASDSNQIFRLKRYNGKSHEHTNMLEGQTFYDFHIHTASEKYQDSGFREDSYAEPTNRYSDYQGAIRCLLEDCMFITPSDTQGKLFSEEV